MKDDNDFLHGFCFTFIPDSSSFCRFYFYTGVLQLLQINPSSIVGSEAVQGSSFNTSFIAHNGGMLHPKAEIESDNTKQCIFI